MLSRKECNQRHIENSDTVCVCNSTYCDDFPLLVRPKPGFALVYESNKNGDRFQPNQLKFKPNFGSKHKSTDNEVTITISKNKIYQKISGFGGGFTDSTGFMLSSVNQSLAKAIIDSYFSDNGIEYSFGRVPVAATDYSIRPYTYDDVHNDKNLAHFALQREDFEFKVSSESKIFL